MSVNAHGDWKDEEQDNLQEMGREMGRRKQSTYVKK